MKHEHNAIHLRTATLNDLPLPTHWHKQQHNIDADPKMIATCINSPAKRGKRTEQYNTDHLPVSD